MIPIRDTTPCRHYPVVNNAIIALNCILFVVQLTQGDDINRFLLTYGLVPARYTSPAISRFFSAQQQMISLLSFMFLHGGIVHLVGNMWMLYIFGDNVEDRLGPIRYSLFYLLCGLGSGLSHFVFNMDSPVPVIGASGAIAGVMGAYFILYPRATVLTLIPVFFIPYFVELPAFIFLGLWFVLQFVYAAGTLGGGSGIAWWAHVGGFLFGILILKAMSAIPLQGVTAAVRSYTAKKKTPRLQIITPNTPADDLDMYAEVAVTPFEALAGATKLVSIPRGTHRKIFSVHVPPGVSTGTVLRLRGLGRTAATGDRGNLMLRVNVGG